MRKFIEKLRFRSLCRALARRPSAKSRIWKAGYDFNRRKLLPALFMGATASVAVSQPAWADQPFTSFTFLATLGTTARTDPERWGDFVNVKDQGAVGNGMTDDHDAIQRALSLAFPSRAGANTRGYVIFPPGLYFVGSALDLNTVQCQGHIFGAGATIIASHAGFIFDNDLVPVATSTASTISGFTFTVGGATTGTFSVGDELTGAGITYYTLITVALGGGQFTISKSHTISTPQAIGASRRPTIFSGVIDGLGLYNSNTAAASGCIRYRGGASSILLTDLDIQGHIGIQLGGQGQSADTCFDSLVQKCRFTGLGGFPSYDTGGIGLLLGPETAAHACSFLAWDNAIRTYGAEQSMIACRCESNNYGVIFGLDSAGAGFASSACSYGSASMEGNTTDLYIVNSSGVTIHDVVTGGEIDGGHGSTYGLLIAGGSQILILNVSINGDYSTAGIAFSGGVDTSSPGVTFINVNTGAGTGGGVAFTFGPLTNQSSLEQINCKNFPTFACSVANLPSYASAGTRRFATGANQTVGMDAWGTAITAGAANQTVPCWKDASAVWRLG